MKYANMADSNTRNAKLATNTRLAEAGTERKNESIDTGRNEAAHQDVQLVSWARTVTNIRPDASGDRPPFTRRNNEKT